MGNASTGSEPINFRDHQAIKNRDDAQAVFFSALTAFALSIHVSWYGWKRWYLLPRVRRAIETTQVVFHVVDETS